MTVGAVVLAAGMAETFGPTQTTGTITVAQRIVATLKQAGISRILVITGYQAEDLERHLTKNDIVFIRNTNYSESQMIDSAKLGISFLQEKCDQILLCPCDIPFFTAKTVRSLMETSGDYIQPTYDNEPGHPIIISSSAAKLVMDYKKTGGIQQALSANGIEPSPVAVDDIGILKKADASTADSEWAKVHTQSLIRPVINISYAKEKIFFDSKIALLFTLIHELGSVSKACAAMQISYTAGWNMIRQIETQIDVQLIKRTKGGSSGSRSELTSEGLELLDSFYQFQNEIEKASTELFLQNLPNFLKE